MARRNFVRNQEIKVMTQSYRNSAADAASKAMRAIDDAGETARDMAATASEAVEAGVAGVKRKATDAKAAVVAGAGSTLETVRDVAVETADAARETLSDAGDRLAATLERASADADKDALQGRVLSTVAQGLTSASDALRQRSVGDLASDVRALAGRHPGAFMAAAAVAGFAAARFMRSSAARRIAERDIESGRGPRV
jgi:hypothetical protein